jgi:hypothetical protein
MFLQLLRISQGALLPLHPAPRSSLGIILVWHNLKLSEDILKSRTHCILTDSWRVVLDKLNFPKKPLSYTWLLNK